ncbi:MAG: integrase core domain-containing protein [Alphaproteobacteria bacterium]
MEAFPWNNVPRHLIRDRDAAYGHVVTRRLRTIGIRDRPTAPGSPLQNGCVEQLIDSIRRECIDYVVVFGETDLRRFLNAYMTYDNEARTHLFLAKAHGISDHSSDSAGSAQSPHLAACIIDTAGYSFW